MISFVFFYTIFSFVLSAYPRLDIQKYRTQIERDFKILHTSGNGKNCLVYAIVQCLELQGILEKGHAANYANTIRANLIADPRIFPRNPNGTRNDKAVLDPAIHVDYILNWLSDHAQFKPGKKPVCTSVQFYSASAVQYKVDKGKIQFDFDASGDYVLTDFDTHTVGPNNAGPCVHLDVYNPRAHFESMTALHNGKSTTPLELTTSVDSSYSTETVSGFSTPVDATTTSDAPTTTSDAPTTTSDTATTTSDSAPTTSEGPTTTSDSAPTTSEGPTTTSELFYGNKGCYPDVLAIILSLSLYIFV